MDLNESPPGDRELPGFVARHSALTSSADIDVRRAAYEALYELAFKVHAKASAAVPALLRGLCDPDAKIGESCLWALAYCQPTSLPGLVDRLSHRDDFVRERAAHSLGNVGDDARVPAARALRRVLSDPVPAVRERAAWALGLMHDDNPLTLRLLGELIASDVATDRSAALHALGNIGKELDDQGALLELKDPILAALEDPDSDVRWSALYASRGLDLDLNARVRSRGALLLRDDSEQVLTAVLSDLKSIGSLADFSYLTPRLIELLGRDGVRTSACEVLEVMRPAPNEAVPSLLALLADERYLIQAGRALFRITGHADAVVEALSRLRALDEGECDLICELGPPAASLVPRLVESLAGESWDLQWAAADALCAVAQKAEGAVPALLEALDRASPIVRSAAARALAQVGPAALEPLRALVKQPRDPRMPWAAYALEAMGPDALAALPELRDGMRSAEARVVRACAFAIARLAGDVSTVPVLIATLLDRDPQAPRSEAAKALGSLGPSAKSAVEPLKRLLKDRDPGLAEAARLALESILTSAH